MNDDIYFRYNFRDGGDSCRSCVNIPKSFCYELRWKSNGIQEQMCAERMPLYLYGFSTGVQLSFPFSIVRIRLLIIVINRNSNRKKMQSNVAFVALIADFFFRHTHEGSTPGYIWCYYSNLHIKTISMLERNIDSTHHAYAKLCSYVISDLQKAAAVGNNYSAECRIANSVAGTLKRTTCHFISKLAVPQKKKNNNFAESALRDGRHSVDLWFSHLPQWRSEGT